MEFYIDIFCTTSYLRAIGEAIFNGSFYLEQEIKNHATSRIHHNYNCFI